MKIKESIWQKVIRVMYECQFNGFVYTIMLRRVCSQSILLKQLVAQNNEHEFPSVKKL